MKEVINQEINKQKEKFDLNIFKQYFSEGEISETSIEGIPKEALELFENESRMYIDPEKYKPGNFEKFFILKHPNKETTYIAKQTKEYGGEAGTEESTYLADMKDDRLTGHSELRYNLTNKNDYFKDKPFIGFIKTEKDLKKSGLGKRKMLIMNAIAKMIYDAPLYLDTVNSPEMKAVWERLLEKGEVKKFKEGPHDRYVLQSFKK